MAWPTTGAGSTASGYVAQGDATTCRWGTDALFGAYTVNRYNAKPLVENIKLGNGVGLTSGRVQLIDGAEFQLTVRDDTRMTPPKVGTVLSIIDAGGLIGNVGVAYNCRVVDAQYDVAPKQAAERTITCEKLTLITES